MLGCGLPRAAPGADDVGGMGLADTVEQRTQVWVRCLGTRALGEWAGMPMPDAKTEFPTYMPTWVGIKFKMRLPQVAWPKDTKLKKILQVIQMMFDANFMGIKFGDLQTLVCQFTYYAQISPNGAPPLRNNRTILKRVERKLDRLPRKLTKYQKKKCHIPGFESTTGSRASERNDRRASNSSGTQRVERVDLTVVSNVRLP